MTKLSKIQQTLVIILSLVLLAPASAMCSKACGSKCDMKETAMAEGGHCQGGEGFRHNCEEEQPAHSEATCCCQKAPVVGDKIYVISQSNPTDQFSLLAGYEEGLAVFNLPHVDRISKREIRKFPRFYSNHLYLLISSLLI